MNKLFSFIALMMLNSIMLFSQVAISTDGSAPDNSAMIDIQSTNKGFLPPRMTNEEMNAIQNPANGLLIFCTDCASDGLGRIAFYQAGAWRTLSFNDCAIPPSAPTGDTLVPSSYQIIWNWNAAEGATGYKWNDTNDYASATDMDAGFTKTETGLTCITSYDRYVWSYNACGHSSAVTLTASTLNCWVCGDPITINHVAGPVAPVSKSVNYGTVANVPGEPFKCWITSNLGASHQADSVNDPTEASAGWYWRFNRQQGYIHDGSTRTPGTTWIPIIDESSFWMEVNDPCVIELGNEWRLPSSSEYSNLKNYGPWSNWNGPWNSALKMHAAGYLNSGDGSLLLRGTVGVYPTDEQWNTTSGKYLYFDSGGCGIFHNYYKASGYTVRCVRYYQP